MEEEKLSQVEEKQINLKFSLWFCIAIAICALVFVIVSAVTGEVCYSAAALGFALLFAEFLRLFIKSKRTLLLIVAIVCAAASALLITLWIIGLCA